MSILGDIAKHRNCKCGICGSTDTYYDKVNKIYKWYKTMVVGEAGFWCKKCYHAVRHDMKKEGVW